MVQSDSILLLKLTKLSFPLLFFLSSLDYSQSLLDKIQRVINCSARLIFKAPKCAHITPLLFSLHWLPVSSQIQYKIICLLPHCVSTAAPYLFELLHLYSPSCSLCLSLCTQGLLCSKDGLAERSFQYIGPVIWNVFLSLSGIPLCSLTSKLKT